MKIPGHWPLHSPRTVAFAVLVLLSGSLLALYGAAAGRAADVRFTPRPTPYRLTGLSAPALAEHAWYRDDHPNRLQVVMYVRETCPYCHAELRHWEALSQADAALVGEAELIVISSDSGTVAGMDLVPAGLAHRRIFDVAGDIGRELGVGAVPYTLYIDAGGSVRRSTLGETSVRHIRENLESFLGGAVQ